MQAYLFYLNASRPGWKSKNEKCCSRGRTPSEYLMFYVRICTSVKLNKELVFYMHGLQVAVLEYLVILFSLDYMNLFIHV